MLTNKALFFYRYTNVKHMNLNTVLVEVNKSVYIKWPEQLLKVSCFWSVVSTISADISRAKLPD